MRSYILSTATRYLLPLLLLFSLFLLYRGHNQPGGGFVGGLIAAAAFSLYTIAHGVEAARYALNVNPRVLIGTGLATALVSGMFAFTRGKVFMAALWTGFEIPALGKLGTPLLFDVGVYLVVLGVTLVIVFSLAEE